MEALLPTEIEKPDKDKKKEEGEEEESEKNVLDESMSEEIDLPDDLQEVVDEVSHYVWHKRLTFGMTLNICWMLPLP